MAISLLVLLVPILLAIWGYRLISSGNEGIDPAPTYQTARATAHYQVLVPTGLPHGWRATSAADTHEPDGSVLRVGYVTPHDGAVQLVESDRPAAALLATELGADARTGGDVRVAGHLWQAYPLVHKVDRALTWTEGNRTVIIVGRAPDADLVRLAESLG